MKIKKHHQLVHLPVGSVVIPAKNVKTLEKIERKEKTKFK